MISDIIKLIRKPSNRAYLLNLVVCDLHDERACIASGFSRKTGQRRRNSDKVLADAYDRIRSLYSQAKEDGSLDDLKSEAAELLNTPEVPTRELALPTALSDDLRAAVETKYPQIKSQQKRRWLECLFLAACKPSFASAIAKVTDETLRGWIESDTEFVAAAKRVEQLYADVIAAELGSYAEHRSDRLFSAFLQSEFPERYAPERAVVAIQNNHYVQNTQSPEEIAERMRMVMEAVGIENFTNDEDE